MVTQDELAALLKSVSGPEVARRARVSLKTVYRLRERENAPRLDIVARLLDAVASIKADEKAALRKAGKRQSQNAADASGA